MTIKLEDCTLVTSGDTTTLTVKNENAYIEHMGEDKEELLRIDNLRHDYLNNTARELADLATEIMKKDDKINEVILEVPYGTSKGDGITGSAKREVKGVIDGKEYTTSPIKLAVRTACTKVTRRNIKKLQKKLAQELSD